MGRTVSGKELLAGQHEFEYNKNQRLLQLLAEGKRALKDVGKKVITVKESLISKTTNQAKRGELREQFEKEFSKYSGKVADTAKIFSKVIGRKKVQEEVVSL